MKRTVWALFVQFANSPLAELTDGWVYQGMFTNNLSLDRATTAVEKDIQATKHDSASMRTVTYKVVELS